MEHVPFFIIFRWGFSWGTKMLWTHPLFEGWYIMVPTYECLSMLCSSRGGGPHSAACARCVGHKAFGNTGVKHTSRMMHAGGVWPPPFRGGGSHLYKREAHSPDHRFGSLFSTCVCNERDESAPPRQARGGVGDFFLFGWPCRGVSWSRGVYVGGGTDMAKRVDG